MTQKKKTGISRLLEFGGCYRWMTVVACILSGLSSVLMLCPFLCIWLVLRDVLAALPDLSTVNVEAMTLYGWMALGLAVSKGHAGPVAYATFGLMGYYLIIR